MTIGAALLLIAVGAILRFAIATVTTHGVDVHTIGDILMIVGVLGLVIWFFVWAPWVRSRRDSVTPVPEERRPPEAYRVRERPPYPPAYPPEIRERSPYPPDDRAYPPERERWPSRSDDRGQYQYPPDERTQEFPR